MRHKNIFDAISERIIELVFIGTLTFVIGFLAGRNYEQNKFANCIEGTDWQIRWQDEPTPPKIQKKILPNGVAKTKETN